MKKRYTLVSKILACTLAATALFSCNKQTPTTSVSASGIATDGIAYVHIDSLVNGYDLYNDEATKLMAKQNQYEAELQSKQKSLERRAMELQNNYEKRLITPTRAQEIQQQLAVESQKLQQTYQQQSMELADDNAMIMNRVGDSIKNFLKVFNADKRYKLILSTQGSSPVLYGDPSMDITNQVLKGLNERYRGNAGAPAAPAADTTAAK
ncbi:MAG: OmpH family outer membrane protein [Bacteroidales bacterium]|nr:OmpH family outer membrane protein [Bacteroidales bacterium]